MTDAQRRWYEANRHTPEYQARLLAAQKRYYERNKAKVAASQKQQRIRREGAMTPADVAALSAKRAARHAERMKDPVYREKKRLQSQAERRRVAADPVRAAQRNKRAAERHALSESKAKPARNAQVDALALVAAVPNSVFGLAAVASGAGAKRRDGGSAPMVADSYEATSWRAPWAAPFALSKPGRPP